MPTLRSTSECVLMDTRRIQSLVYENSSRVIIIYKLSNGRFRTAIVLKNKFDKNVMFSAPMRKLSIGIRPGSDEPTKSFLGTTLTALTVGEELQTKMTGEPSTCNSDRINPTREN